MSDLRSWLERIDGRPYGHYRDLRGERFGVGRHRLRVEHVQGDPFAAPSRVRVDVAPDVLALPGFAFADPDARRAAADRVQRLLSAAFARVPVRSRGKLELSYIYRNRGKVEAGIKLERNRRHRPLAAELLVDRLPDALDRTLDALDRDALRGHVECVQDQVSLRSSLRERGLVAFLADDSRLPRKSGADTRPLAHAVPLVGASSTSASGGWSCLSSGRGSERSWPWRPCAGTARAATRSSPPSSHSGCTTTFRATVANAASPIPPP